jgi:pilus assembly protein Flp/PilA
MTRAAVYFATLFTLIGDRFENRSKDRGATAVEYGLMVGLIAVAIIGTLVILGPQLNALFDNVSDKLPAAPATP